MQTDVKVFIPEMLVDIFPGLTVKCSGEKFVHYNLHTNFITDEQIKKLADLNAETGVELFIGRWGKGLTIKFSPGVGIYKDIQPEINSEETVVSKRQVFIELANPMIDFLQKNSTPHATVIIDCNHAELLEGEIVYSKSDHKES